MAVYTHIDETDLTNFLEKYALGSAISLKGIAEGVENSNYFLETRDDNGKTSRFILTIYEKRANPEELPYFLGLTSYLARNKIPAPQPISDRHGNLLNELKGKPACIIEFLDGVSVAAPSQDQCAALGATLAAMHSALEGFQPVRENDLSLAGWQRLVDATIDQADSVETGLASLIADEIDFLRHHWPDHLPKGTIHADLFPDNVLFLGNKINGLIDFYFACTDITAFDIAVCFDSWCFGTDGRFKRENAKRLLEMYDAHRPLSPAEMDAIPILCRGSSLRFLLTRLYDWINPVTDAVVKPKDPRLFAQQLRFHQNMRDTADYVV